MKPRWVCTICGMWSTRYWNVQRHISNLHGGTGGIVSFMDYVIGVRSDTYKPPRGETKRSFTSLDFSNDVKFLTDMERLAELVARNEQRMMRFLSEEPIQQRFTEKAIHIGYRAMVCESCLRGYVQAMMKWGTEATSFSSTSLPEHECLAKDLETAKHLDKTVEMQIVWKNLEERLITIVGKWGKSEKLALSIPWNSKEEKCVDLGAVEEGHWAQRAAEGATVLKEPELQDFLRRAHATEGIFRLTLKGGSRVVRITLVSEYEKSNSKGGLSQGEKKVIGYRGYVCERCFTAEALELYLNGKELSERKHQCDPTRIFRADLFNVDGTFRHPRDELPRILLESVKSWAKDRKYLQAVKAERNDNYIELCSVNENHWADRAIKGRIILDEKELSDFLKKAEATFGIFKIKKGKVEDFYYMMISDVPSEIIK